MRELEELLLAYAPQPSFDDVAWFGLAYARVYEANKTEIDFLRVSKDIFNWIWKHGWDESGILILYPKRVGMISHNGYKKESNLTYLSYCNEIKIRT